MTRATATYLHGPDSRQHPPIAVEASISVLGAARRGAGHAEFEALAALSEADLRASLPTDREKLAFWINVYNAGIQRELRRDPGLYRRRFWFFSHRGVTVAGRFLSFNAIEHGLLRRSMLGYSLGYLSNPFPGRFERRFRVAARDPRVHFALNCGARSCPPVAAYRPEMVDAQLDLAARSYLEQETTYDQEAGVVTVPRLFLWFRGDFGGPGGMRDLLRRYGIIPPGANPRPRYGNYDWTLTLD